MQVREYMTPAPITIERTADYKEAFPLIGNNRMHHLPVVNDSQQVVGIIAQRDLKFAAQHYREAPVAVEDMMHEPVISIDADADMVAAAELLIKENIGCLTVINDDEQLVGIVTEKDMLRAFIDLLQHTAK